MGWDREWAGHYKEALPTQGMVGHPEHLGHPFLPHFLQTPCGNLGPGHLQDAGRNRHSARPRGGAFQSQVRAAPVARGIQYRIETEAALQVWVGGGQVVLKP